MLCTVYEGRNTIMYSVYEVMVDVVELVDQSVMYSI